MCVCSVARGSRWQRSHGRHGTLLAAACPVPFPDPWAPTRHGPSPVHTPLAAQSFSAASEAGGEAGRRVSSLVCTIALGARRRRRDCPPPVPAWLALSATRKAQRRRLHGTHCTCSDSLNAPSLLLCPQQLLSNAGRQTPPCPWLPQQAAPEPHLEVVSEHALGLLEFRGGKGQAWVLILPHLLKLQPLKFEKRPGAEVRLGKVDAQGTRRWRGWWPPPRRAAPTFLMCCRISSSRACALRSLGSARFSNSRCGEVGSRREAGMRRSAAEQGGGEGEQPRRRGSGRRPPPSSCARRFLPRC